MNASFNNNKNTLRLIFFQSQKNSADNPQIAIKQLSCEIRKDLFNFIKAYIPSEKFNL